MEDRHRPISDSSDERPTGRILLDGVAETILSVVLFCFRFFGWAVRWTFATILFLGIMAGAGWFVFNQAVEGGAHVVVPDVVGWPVDKAQLALSQAGLELGRQTQKASDQFPEYHVMLQRPGANDVVRQGRKISVTISAGRQSEAAPNLVGKTFDEAIQDLGATRLLVGRRASIHSDAPKYMVLAQDPAAGRLLEGGTEISLLVSDGPATPTMFMPQLVKLSIEKAEIALAPLNLNIERYDVEAAGIQYVQYDVVLAQTPEAVTTMVEGDRVTFDVRYLPNSVPPNVWRRVTLRYIVPDMPTRPTIQIEVIDRNNDRRTLYPLAKDYDVNGRPPRLDPRSSLFTKFEYIQRATVECYVNGQLERTYRYEDSAEPEITIMDAAPLSAVTQIPSEELPLATGFEPRAIRINRQR